MTQCRCLCRVFSLDRHPACVVKRPTVMVTASSGIQHAAITFAEVNRTSVTDQAIESFLDLVRRGVLLLRAGDRLPSQRELVVQQSFFS